MEQRQALINTDGVYLLTEKEAEQYDDIQRYLKGNWVGFAFLAPDKPGSDNSIRFQVVSSAEYAPGLWFAVNRAEQAAEVFSETYLLNVLSKRLAHKWFLHTTDRQTWRGEMYVLLGVFEDIENVIRQTPGHAWEEAFMWIRQKIDHIFTIHKRREELSIDNNPRAAAIARDGAYPGDYE